MDKKKAIIGIIIIIAIAFVFSLKPSSSISKNDINPTQISNLHQATFEIEEMYCISCAYGIEAQMKELDGVVSATVDYTTATGIATYDADKVTPEEIAKTSTVYPATVIQDIKL